MKLLLVLILAVSAIVMLALAAGILNMARGGKANMSQKLMRLRVAAQALAIVIVLGAIYFFGW